MTRATVLGQFVKKAAASDSGRVAQMQYSRDTRPRRAGRRDRCNRFCSASTRSLSKSDWHASYVERPGNLPTTLRHFTNPFRLVNPSFPWCSPSTGDPAACVFRRCRSPVPTSRSPIPEHADHLGEFASECVSPAHRPGADDVGPEAVGDPSLMRQIEGGRSPSLRTADRVLAFIDTYDPGLGRGAGSAAPSRAPGAFVEDRENVDKQSED